MIYFGPRDSQLLWQDRFSAAGGHSAPNCSHAVNRDILHLRGFTHDTIAAVATLCEEGIRSLTVDWEGYMMEWRKFASRVTGLTQVDIEQAFHSTETAGFFHSDPTKEQIAEYERARNSACMKRRFFVTSKGAFGLGSRWTSKGDRICVLLGACVPFLLAKDRKHIINDKWELVLRSENKLTSRLKPFKRIPTGDIFYPAWKFMGEAYVHGIMNYKGDIKSDIASGKLVLENFYVC
jgi:hypothetical protein